MTEKIIARERINLLMFLSSNNEIIKINKNDNKINLFCKIISNNRKNWAMHILQFCGCDISLLIISIEIWHINNKTTDDKLSIIVNFLDIDPFKKKTIRGHMTPIIANNTNKSKIFINSIDYDELMAKYHNLNNIHSYHITHSSNMNNILFYKHHINNAIRKKLINNYSNLNVEDYIIDENL
jgi:hypothetical protein